jgi:hypothetical protein
MPSRKEENMAKKLDFMPYSKCPECGKENMVRNTGDPGWCNDAHKKNYEFKQRSEGGKFKA